ncbi:hypothetical protein L484_012341 [Morus notabilis]|uniref:F-box/FBD/LRR-repeat protein n=1 Tax=Morus notabilis TaxID=981085 RepID=W9SFD8_9ROSA|nr:hypothetical protein L484_012341 [Morus notabilis]
MRDLMEPDLISDLRESITEKILTHLPIRDAVRTSILSSKWRYNWASITQLVFGEDCGYSFNYLHDDQKRLIEFITKALLLHQGLIHSFQLAASDLGRCPDTDQWIVFLSRNDIKEIVLEMGQGELVRDLTLHNCKVRRDVSENLISICLYLRILPSCPLLPFVLLQTFSMIPAGHGRFPTDFHEVLNDSGRSWTFSGDVPTDFHESLDLDGESRDINHENTSLLAAISVAIYAPEDIVELFEQSSSWILDKFLGEVPRLESLIGWADFTKCLSIGYDMGKIAITFYHLKVIQLNQVSFKDIKEIYAVLRLITTSPNLEQLQISGCSEYLVVMEAPELDVWRKEGRSKCAFKKLKHVNIRGMSSVP